MNGRLRPIAPLLFATLVAGCALPCTGALAAGAQPLAGSNYRVRAACPPPGPGHGSCLALQLVPASARARAHDTPIGLGRTAGATPAAHNPAAGSFGLRPQDLHTAYELPATATSAQTIAVIDAYNDPTAEADLASYSSMFGLAACTSENGCFKQVGENGTATLPFPESTAELEGGGEEAEAAIGWGAEISLDIESAHAVCPNCHILLVEATTTSYSDLEKAEKAAETLGASEISNSWGGPEEGVSPVHDAAGPFNDPKVVITASTGDTGYRGWDAEFEEEKGFTNYPAASPYVVAVGGTHLTLGAGGTWAGESVWNGNGASGGGCSVQFAAPAWQQALADWSEVGCAGKRVIADVAADADPQSGIAVFDSSPACESEYSESGTKHVVHWCTYGGTSLASPIIASVFALAGGAHGVSYPAQTLYANEHEAPSRLHDVTSGSNGECALASCTQAEEAAASCASTLSCQAGPGFDGPSGVGTPHGILGFAPAEAGGKEEEPVEEKPAEEKPSEKPSEKPAEQTAGETETRQEKGTPPTPPAPHPTPGPTTPSAPAKASAMAPVVSALGLTVRALAALNAHRPPASRVAFAFKLSASAEVKLTLARQIRVHHRARWRIVGATSALSAGAGPNSARLTGRARLAPGLYRLTVSPSAGRPRSIVFHIG